MPITTTAHATWLGDLKFESGAPGGPAATFDGDAVTGQSPVQALLTAIATCSGADVAEILAKRRTPPTRLEIGVSATRRETPPRRVLRLDMLYDVEGAGIDAAQVERAIRLSMEKYCSVVTSLNPDIDLIAAATVNGTRGETMRIPITPPGAEGQDA
jgi:putative redox protein